MSIPADEPLNAEEQAQAIEELVNEPEPEKPSARRSKRAEPTTEELAAEFDELEAERQALKHQGKPYGDLKGQLHELRLELAKRGVIR